MQLNNFYKIEPDQWMFKDHPDVKSQIKKYKKNPNVDDNEEFVRQWILSELIKNYNYPSEWVSERIFIEDQIRMGSTSKEVEFVDVVEGLTQMSGIKNEIYQKHNSKIISQDSASETKIVKILTTTFSEIVSSDIEIDYLSIDIEGSEFELLESIDFDKYKIKVISVENNLPDDQDFQVFFSKKQFKYFDRVGQDEIFFNNNFFKIG